MACSIQPNCMFKKIFKYSYVNVCVTSVNSYFYTIVLNTVVCCYIVLHCCYTELKGEKASDR